MKKLKILHLLSQRPDSTGSGIYVQAMIREAAALIHDNYLVAGVGSDCCDDTDFIQQDKSMFVNFNHVDVSYHIPGMSDVMPYESTRFCDLSEEDLCEYEKAFSKTIQMAVSSNSPPVVYPTGKPMILHLLRCQGIAVNYYNFTLGRLEAGASSTFATSGFNQ